jgi:3-oxoacyl-(acyl-carrier-protein) synthase
LQVSLNDLLQQNHCTLSDLDAVIVGVSGNKYNDRVYHRTASALFPHIPLVRYKHIFGECYTASGLGMYAAATCIQKQRIPAHLFVDKQRGEMRGVKNMLLYNQVEGKQHSWVLLINEQ